MFLDFISNIHPRHQPWITRQSYTHELVTAMTIPVATSMIDGAVIGVLAKKLFEVDRIAFATIMAAPMFANLTSFIWARMSRGLPKIPSICALQTALLVSIAAIAVLPTAGVGPALLTGLVVCGRCLLAGIITLRSTVWRQNYPRLLRAQVTGRLAMVGTCTIAIAPLVGYALLDQNPHIFRVIYPVSAAVGIIGVVAFRRIRLRRERDLLRFETRPAARPRPHGAPGPIYEYDPHAINGFWSVLRRDHLFRRYMQWQFLAGMGAMMGDVAIIYWIADLTHGQPHQYVISICITTAIPTLMVIMTLPKWARYLDRVHVTELRTGQSALVFVSLILTWFGAAAGALPIVALARLVVGISRGGGVLAWNLGHNDFAARHLVTLYMGIHVTLTGVRGALGPFLVMALYGGWSDRFLGIGFPAFTGLGPHVLLISAAIEFIAILGFWHLSRSIGHRGTETQP